MLHLHFLQQKNLVGYTEVEGGRPSLDRLQYAFGMQQEVISSQLEASKTIESTKVSLSRLWGSELGMNLSLECEEKTTIIYETLCNSPSSLRVTLQ